jgi:uncharacterized OsmC-like protein
MRMILEGESRIRLEMVGEGFGIKSDRVSISPYHLLAGSLASCIGLVMAAWAGGAGVDVRPVTISIGWEHAEDEGNRVKLMEVEVHWPGLPDSRKVVAERLVEACPIHATLLSGTAISSRVRVA